MTNDEIRIAIAQACGWRWKIYDDGNLDAVWSPGPNGKWEGSFVEFIEGLPNYPEDLNAMREAISTLKEHEEMWNYLRELKEIVTPHFDWEEFMCAWCLMNATAHQRAEAFLRLKGLWKE